jgi:transposase
VVLRGGVAVPRRRLPCHARVWTCGVAYLPGLSILPALERILAEVGDGTAFPAAAHLASYAGLIPTTHRSGISIRGRKPASRR